jgi:hypothetical protein
VVIGGCLNEASTLLFADLLHSQQTGIAKIAALFCENSSLGYDG